MTDEHTPESAPTIVAAALRGLCPRCGATGLFASAISFKKSCSACALDFESFNVGDGPAAFIILIIGAIVSIGAVALQLSAEPPFWVHILIWIPVTMILALLSLRAGKAALLSAEYRNQARQGKLDQ
jgi:uncharacterized protein (DUF983 family)